MPAKKKKRAPRLCLRQGATPYGWAMRPESDGPRTLPPDFPKASLYQHLDPVPDEQAIIAHVRDLSKRLLYPGSTRMGTRGEVQPSDQQRNMARAVLLRSEGSWVKSCKQSKAKGALVWLPRYGYLEIAEMLNAEGRKTPLDNPYTRMSVQNLVMSLQLTQRPYSYRQIAKTLEREGYFSRTGRAFSHPQIKRMVCMQEINGLFIPAMKAR